MKRKSVIFGIKGIKLNKDEKNILKYGKPWGVILFSRNIINTKQLAKLTKEIRKYVNDKKYPILIDQEGGRVSRLNKIFNFKKYSQNYFGDLYKFNKQIFEQSYKFYIKKVSKILNQTGININTSPVLDILRKDSNKIIGDRSYSKNHRLVSKIGNKCIKLFAKNNIATVMKHIPGHGLAKSDSHKKLPIIKNKMKELEKRDFYPFKNCKPFFAMTAHIVYHDYDPKYVATQSKTVINKIIRKKIGFKGLLISDDISMKALKFKLEENAIRALNAGCNLILHCNANPEEMRKLINIVPYIDKFVIKKTTQFYQFLG